MIENPKYQNPLFPLMTKKQEERNTEKSSRETQTITFLKKRYQIDFHYQVFPFGLFGSFMIFDLWKTSSRIE